MTRSQEFAEFCLVMAQAYPDKNQEDLAKSLVSLWKLADTIKRLSVAECNRELSDIEKDRMKNSEQKAEKISKEMGFKLQHMSDARGYALKFILPTERYNSMGGKECGWGI